MTDNQYVNAIPTSLNDLLVKLRFLSLIKSGYKVNLGTMSFTTGKTLLSRVHRNLAGENRSRLMNYLTQIVAETMKAIEDYHGTQFCRLLINHLADAKTGITNLATTYTSDPNVSAQLAVCLANIELQLTKNRTLLDGHVVNPTDDV